MEHVVTKLTGVAQGRNAIAANATRTHDDDDDDTNLLVLLLLPMALSHTHTLSHTVLFAILAFSRCVCLWYE